MRLFIIIAAAGLLLGGCNPAPESRFDTQAFEAERARREQVEARLTEEETSTSLWKTAALLALGAIGIALIVGAMLGSDARKDADQQ